MAQYDYTISTAFPNQAVSSDRLTQEIQQSAIVTALDHIDTADGVCSIVFKASLSGGDEALLDGLVAAHSGAALATAPMAVALTGLDLNRDNRLIVQPVTLTKGQWHYWHGEGDDIAATPQTVGGGQAFEASCSTADDCVVEWSYRDPVWIAGGSFRFQGAQMGDKVSFVIYAPATAVVANVGGTGNCNLVGAVIVPAAGNGAYDVDLATCNPIPTADEAPYSGYWEHALPANMKGRGTTTPSSTPGQAKYHLLAVDYDLDRFVNGERLLGSGENFYEPQNINVSLCMPGWEFKCTLHNETGTHTVEAVWRVLVSRYWTTQ